MGDFASLRDTTESLAVTVRQLREQRDARLDDHYAKLADHDARLMLLEAHDGGMPHGMPTMAEASISTASGPGVVVEGIDIARNELHVSIEDAMDIAAGLWGAKAYLVKLHMAGDDMASFAFSARFSEFDRLHEDLCKAHTNVPALPRKWGILFWHREALEQRRQQLEKYLQRLVALYDFRQEPLMYDFLQVPKWPAAVDAMRDGSTTLIRHGRCFGGHTLFLCCIVSILPFFAFLYAPRITVSIILVAVSIILSNLSLLY